MTLVLFMALSKVRTNCSNSSPLTAEAFLTRIFRFAQDDGCGLGRPQKRRHFGCSICAIMTCRLKFSTMLSSRRTSVGRLASDIWSILSCSFSSA